MHFKEAGDREYGVKYNFSHFCLLAKGKLTTEVNGVQTDFTAPTIIIIDNNDTYNYIAASDETVAYIIHGLREDLSSVVTDKTYTPASEQLPILIDRLFAK